MQAKQKAQKMEDWCRCNNSHTPLAKPVDHDDHALKPKYVGVFATRSYAVAGHPGMQQRFHAVLDRGRVPRGAHGERQTQRSKSVNSIDPALFPRKEGATRHVGPSEPA